MVIHLFISVSVKVMKELLNLLLNKANIQSINRVSCNSSSLSLSFFAERLFLVMEEEKETCGPGQRARATCHGFPPLLP
jgi:hypothetical protein